MVAPEPGGGVGDQRKARGVALGEPVLAEPADLLEHPLGELALDPLGHHPPDQPLPVALDPAALAPGRHVAP